MMSTIQNQQTQLLNVLVDLFRSYLSVYAIILGGSMVERPEAVDGWSDIDLKLVVDAGSEEVFLNVESWIAPIGQLVGVEKMIGNESATIRICLENYQRIDLVVIPLNAFTWSIPPSRKILWQREPIPVTTVEEDNQGKPDSFELVSSAVLQKVNALWFQSAVAIAKVVRHDYLIAYHLTLKVMQGVLELQMMRRDSVMETNIHRKAGWGNELVSQFPQVELLDTQQGILQTLEIICGLLDQVARRMLPDYQVRLPLLESSIQKAKEQPYAESDNL